MRTNKTALHPKLKVLGIYQIIGGVLGVLSIAQLFNSNRSYPLILLLLILGAVGLFLYSIFCGIQLFKMPLLGLKHSKINQLLQTVHLAIGGYAFQYVSGAHFSIGLNLTESFVFKFNLSLSTWQINLNSDDPDLIVTVNLVALFLIAFIDRMLKQLQRAEAEAHLADLVPKEEPQPLTPYL